MPWRQVREDARRREVRAPILTIRLRLRGEDNREVEHRSGTKPDELSRQKKKRGRNKVYQLVFPAIIPDPPAL